MLHMSRFSVTRPKHAFIPLSESLSLQSDAYLSALSALSADSNQRSAEPSPRRGSSASIRAMSCARGARVNRERKPAMVQRHLTTRIARDDERSQLIDTLRPFLGDVVSGEDELYLTTREVALLLGVSPATVRRWADLTKLRAHRSFGGHRKF